MGASEILKALEKGDKLTTIEIAQKVNYSEAAVKQAIKRLLKDVSENVEFRFLTQEEKVERYGRKLGCRIRLYWLEE